MRLDRGAQPSALDSYLLQSNEFCISVQVQKRDIGQNRLYRMCYALLHGHHKYRNMSNPLQA